MAADLESYREFDGERPPVAGSDVKEFDPAPRVGWVRVTGGALTVVLSVIGASVGLTPPEDR